MQLILYGIRFCCISAVLYFRRVSNKWVKHLEYKEEGYVVMADNVREHMKKDGFLTDIPFCKILGVNISTLSMQESINFIEKNLAILSGKYICVANVHTTVMSFDNSNYRDIQNGSVMSLPDGAPLSTVARKRGYKNAERVTGPDLMRELFKESERHGYKHYFYGGKPETLELLQKKLQEKYPNIIIAGMYSPPFRELTEKEDKDIIENVNQCKPDFIWVGLGAPKQEKWMAAHMGKVHGLMIGVGAGFEYHAGNLKRAPEWMQSCSLEWLYRLMQEPKRLVKRYLYTNLKFIWLIMRGK